MKFLKKWSFVLSTIIIATSLLLGCDSPLNNADKTRQKDIAKELTIQEVLTKTEESNKDNGVIFKIKGKFSINLPSKNIEQEVDQTQKFIYNPATLHAIDKINKTEFYIVDNELYMNNFPKANDWVKFPAESLRKLNIPLPMNTPNELIKVVKMLGTDTYTMQKENGAYVLTFDSTKLKDPSKLTDAFLPWIKGIKNKNLNANEQKDAEQALRNAKNNKIKYNTIKQIITIDEKTFKIKNVEMLQEFTLKVKDQDMTYKQDERTEFIGVPASITVPEDIQKNAKEMKL